MLNCREVSRQKLRIFCRQKCGRQDCHNDAIDDEGDKDDDFDDNCPAVIMLIMYLSSNPHDNHVHTSFAFQLG